MIEIVQSPNEPSSEYGIKLFLAGGISNCPNWQDDITNRLSNENKIKDALDGYDFIKIFVFNPRCKEIPEERPQIIWEDNKLKQSDIISFWFSVGSLNPITLFEYGTYMNSNKTIIFGVHPEYTRKETISIQTEILKPKQKMIEDFELFYEEIVEELLKRIELYKIIEI